MTNRAEDEIVDEIRRRREAHAESLGFDLSRIVEDLRRHEREAGIEVLNRPPRKPEPVPKRSSA